MNEGQTNERAAITLARLVSQVCDVTIDPEKLTKLLCDRWSSVSNLAHAIHNGGRQ